MTLSSASCQTSNVRHHTRRLCNKQPHVYSRCLVHTSYGDSTAKNAAFTDRVISTTGTTAAAQQLLWRYGGVSGLNVYGRK